MPCRVSALLLLTLLLGPLPARAEFLLGIYTSNHTTFDLVQKMGFQLVIGPHTDTDFREARRRGLKVIPNWFGDDSVSLERFHALDGDTTIMAWYPFDEPDIYNRSPDSVREKIAILRRASPSKPIFMTVYRPPRYADYSSFADWFCITPYPIHSDRDPRLNRLSTVHSFTAAARALRHDDHLVTAIQCFRQAPWWLRAPTPDELHNMVYQALAGGANAIVHFIVTVESPDGTTWDLRSRPDLVRRLTLVNRQIRSLDAVLEKGDDAAEFIAQVDPPESIHRLVRSDNGLFLFFANPNTSPVSTRFEFRLPLRSIRLLHSNLRPRARLQGASELLFTLPPLACGVIRLDPR